MAVKTVANTLAESGDVFARDDDPELIREAIPFGLKLNESLLESVPTHAPLLISTCSSFALYAYGFVEIEADVIGPDRAPEGRVLRDRALKLYQRAQGYCFRAMEVRFPGSRERLLQDAAAVVGEGESRRCPAALLDLDRLGRRDCARPRSAGPGDRPAECPCPGRSRAGPRSHLEQGRRPRADDRLRQPAGVARRQRGSRPATLSESGRPAEGRCRPAPTWPLPPASRSRRRTGRNTSVSSRRRWRSIPTRIHRPGWPRSLRNGALARCSIRSTRSSRSERVSRPRSCWRKHVRSKNHHVRRARRRAGWRDAGRARRPSSSPPRPRSCPAGTRP